MQVYDIIKKLQATSSRNEKQAILESIKGTSLELTFKKVCVLAYEPTITFGAKDVEWPDTDNLISNTLDESSYLLYEGNLTLDKAFDIVLAELATRKITGNAARHLLCGLYNSLSNDDAKVLQSVIERDLKAGISAKTINKVFADLIYVHPYMRGSSFSAKNLKAIKFPCFSQTKEDGEYEDIIITSASGKPTVEVRSRSGAINNHYLSDDVIESLKNRSPDNTVLMGEVLVYEDATRQKLMERAKGNGYLNSNDVDPERLLHTLWDAVPYEDFLKKSCSVPYIERFVLLQHYVRQFAMDTDQIKLIDSRFVGNVDGVIEHFMENVSAGLEGVMVKNNEMLWEDGTSKESVKVKVEFECELIITRFKQGKTMGELDEIVGSIESESSDGILSVNVGGGISDDLRKLMWANRDSYLGKIITVKSNDVITNEANPEKMSLFLPRLVKFRNDKTEADSYDRIMEQKKAFVHTLEAIEKKG